VNEVVVTVDTGHAGFVCFLVLALAGDDNRPTECRPLRWLMALSVYLGGRGTHLGAEARGHRKRHMMAMAGL
jgi:hypothetical protein